jgi:triosephosphate isomerase
MASVLDAVLESTRVPTPAFAKEDVEAATARVEVEAGPSVAIETEPVEAIGQSTKQGPSNTTLILEKEGASKKVKSYS